MEFCDPKYFEFKVVVLTTYFKKNFHDNSQYIIYLESILTNVECF